MILNRSLDAFGFSPVAWPLICFVLLMPAFACGLYVWSMDPTSSSLVEVGNFCLFAAFGCPGCSGVASLLIAGWLDVVGLLQVHVFYVLFWLRGSLFL